MLHSGVTQKLDRCRRQDLESVLQQVCNTNNLAGELDPAQLQRKVVLRLFLDHLVQVLDAGMDGIVSVVEIAAHPVHCGLEIIGVFVDP